MKLLATVCAALEASAIPYALIGAGALTVRGVGRAALVTEVESRLGELPPEAGALWSRIRDAEKA